MNIKNVAIFHGAPSDVQVAINAWLAKTPHKKIHTITQSQLSEVRIAISIFFENSD